MSVSVKSFIGARRFLPLLATHVLGAFNDNFFKNALVILLLYRLGGEDNAALLVTGAAGLFILPYILLSALGGELADSREKSRLMKQLKAAEIAIMALGGIGFWLQNVPLLMGALFLMGAQSALFSPVKYSILPEHLKKEELIGGNAVMEGAVYLAILLGTIAGSLLILGENGLGLVAGCTLVIACAGTLSSLLIPKAPIRRPDLKVSLNLPRETWNVLKASCTDRRLFWAILAIGWFHFMGATYLTQFPAFAKSILQADEAVVTLFLATFSVGIALGAVGCQLLLRGEITPRLLPFAILGISLFGLDLVFASPDATALISQGALQGAEAFLQEPAHWRILMDLLLVAACGGVFIVPLYAMIQSGSAPESRARLLAASNIVNALFVVLSSALAALLLSFAHDPKDLFLYASLANVLVSVLVIFLVPNSLLKPLLVRLLRAAFRIEVSGLAHLAKAPKGALLTANHVSYLDGAVLGAVLPGEPLFIVNKFTAQKWWAWPFIAMIEALKLDPVSPYAAKHMIKRAKLGQTILVFPEGRITDTGGVMKLYDGAGLVADKAGVPVIPIHIEGLERSKFSRMRGKLRLSWFPKVKITILPPQPLTVPSSLKGRKRREALSLALSRLMDEAAFAARPQGRDLYQALLDARARHSGAGLAFEDAERIKLSRDRLITGARLLGRLLAKISQPTEKIGVFLPNSAGTMVTFFALQASGRIPAMLNFSSGPATLVSTAQTAQLSLILTSRRFIAKGKLEKAINALEEAGMSILYLEDLRGKIGSFTRFFGLLRTKLFPDAYQRVGTVRPSPQDPAVILFTSGSEGLPKGVVLSHDNLLTNCAQLTTRVDYTPQDKVLNALPLFHAFGLAGGTLLPLFGGVTVFLYPSPLHYRMIPEYAYECGATIMFGTDSFLYGYGRMAHPYDFRNMRLVFAGAEKVREETRRQWADKFGIRILEGYGATETSPVIAVNGPRHARAGTVGPLLPGLDMKIEPIPGISEGGKLWVRGKNVMLGYLKAERPGHLHPLATSETAANPWDDPWYDTGDVVILDDDGHLRLQARVKRFAKIAGEMISLPLIEDLATSLWPDARHAAITMPVQGRGEQVALFSETSKANRRHMLEEARNKGLSDLMVPKVFDFLEKIPLLPTGKIDYVQLKKVSS